MRFGLIFEIIRSRFALISLIFLVTLASAVGASLLMSKKYEAASVLYVDISQVNQVSGATEFSNTSVRNKLSNQVEIIRSDAVIQRAIEILGYDKDSGIIDAWIEDTNGEGDLASWLAPGLVRPLEAEPSLDGTTITLAYETTSGKRAADIVNAFSNAYIQESLDLRTRKTKETAAFFEQEVEKNRQLVQAAEAKLSEFERENGIVATDKRFDVENQKLQDLTTRLVAAESDLSEAQARQKTARGRGGSAAPEVVQNALIQSLKADVSQAKSRMGQVRAKFGKNHPNYKRAESELSQLQSQLYSEIRNVTRSLRSGSRIAQRRVNDLKKAVEKQRATVLSLKSSHDKISVLQRELDTAIEALDTSTKRARETKLIVAGTSSNVSILTPAVAPLLPSRPNLLVNSIVGAILGLFLGFAAALTLEAASRPLRSSEDLLNAAGVPILAVLPKASSTKAQRLIGSTGPAVVSQSANSNALRLTQ